MSVIFCREKLDKERSNLPLVVPIEKLNIKSCIAVDSAVKSKGSKTHPKMSSKVHKVINVLNYIYFYSIYNMLIYKILLIRKM